MQNLKQCLSSEQQYKFLKQFRENIQDNNESTLILVGQTVIQILEDPQSEPIQKVLSARFVKELMDLHQQNVVDLISGSILASFEKVAEFDLQQGKFYFSQDPDQQTMVLGNTFVRLISECIFVWNIWYPNTQFQTSPYAQCYERLLKKGIIFPKLRYFNAQKVREYYVAQKLGISKIQKSAYFQQQSLSLAEFDFVRLKKTLETNKYKETEVQFIMDKLKQLSNPNLQQQAFINNLAKTYQDYLQYSNFDDFQIAVQAICLEYDEEVFDKQAAMESFQDKHELNINTPSKIQAGGYSTDKYSQFLSNGSFDSSQNSTPQNMSTQKQIQILSEKNKKIEQLLQENSTLSNQVQQFEKQIQILKSQCKSQTESKDSQSD